MNNNGKFTPRLSPFILSNFNNNQQHSHPKNLTNIVLTEYKIGNEDRSKKAKKQRLYVKSYS